MFSWLDNVRLMKEVKLAIHFFHAKRDLNNTIRTLTISIMSNIFMFSSSFFLFTVEILLEFMAKYFTKKSTNKQNKIYIICIYFLIVQQQLEK